MCTGAGQELVLSCLLVLTRIWSSSATELDEKRRLGSVGLFVNKETLNLAQNGCRDVPHKVGQDLRVLCMSCELWRKKTGKLWLETRFLLKLCLGSVRRDLPWFGNSQFNKTKSN